MSNGTALSLSEAATAVGMVKSSILRAIRSGKISATRDLNNQWRIEPAELFRAFEPVAEGNGAVERGNGAVERHAIPETVALAEANARAALAEQRLSDLKGMLEDMRGERDDWKEQAMRLTLPAPKAEPEPEKPRPWSWRWLRSTA